MANNPHEYSHNSEDSLERLSEKKPKPDLYTQNKIISALQEKDPRVLEEITAPNISAERRKEFLTQLSTDEISVSDAETAICSVVKKPFEGNPEATLNVLSLEILEKPSIDALINLGLGREPTDRISSEHVQQFLERFTEPHKAAKFIGDTLEDPTVVPQSKKIAYAHGGLKLMEIAYGKQWLFHQQLKILKQEAMLEEDKKPLASNTIEKRETIRTTSLAFQQPNHGELIEQEAQCLIDEIEKVKATPGKSETILGRKLIIYSKNDVITQDFNERWGITSGTQLVFRKKDKGQYEIEDLSTNGTSVNGELVGKGNSKNLKEGDKISWQSGRVGGIITITI